MDEKINEMIRDEKQYDQVTRPVCAFVTFEKDDGVNFALDYTKDSKKRFLSKQSLESSDA